jgi:hypothetical protein
MKIITNIFFIILFVCLSTIISFSKDDACFKLYVCDFETVKDTTKLNEFIKLNEPLITDDYIIKYNADTNKITLSDEGWDRLNQVINNFKSFTLETGIPFVITLNNNLHFDGVFWFIQSSFLPPKKPKIHISGFFDSKQKTLYFPINVYLSKSDSLIKQELLFIDCLKAQGKVVE